MKYSGTLDCYKQTYAEGGLKGMWTGWGPNCVRNSMVNATELASYDQYKQIVLGYKLLKEGIPCHLVCATLAGITTVCICSPIDVLKTRLMNAKHGEFKTPIDCLVQTAKNEGVGAFYKGFIPNCVRLAGWN